MPQDARSVPLDDFPALPRDTEGPVFREPWEAQVFAITVTLHEAGHFTWDEWANRLGQEISDAVAAGDADLGDTYYRHWLAALEGLCSEKGIVTAELLSRRTDAWSEAYRSTPHGQPVVLES